MQVFPVRGPLRSIHPERFSRPVRPAVLFDVAERASELLRGTELHEFGHVSRTLFVEGKLRLVLIGLRAGVRIPQHHTIQPTTVQTLLGHARLHCGGAPRELLPGTVLIFEPGTLHELEAVENCALLFSLVWLDG